MNNLVPYIICGITLILVLYLIIKNNCKQIEKFTTIDDDSQIELSERYPGANRKRNSNSSTTKAATAKDNSATTDDDSQIEMSERYPGTNRKRTSNSATTKAATAKDNSATTKAATADNSETKAAAAAAKAAAAAAKKEKNIKEEVENQPTINKDSVNLFYTNFIFNTVVIVGTFIFLLTVIEKSQNDPSRTNEQSSVLVTFPRVHNL